VKCGMFAMGNERRISTSFFYLIHGLFGCFSSLRRISSQNELNARKAKNERGNGKNVLRNMYQLLIYKQQHVKWIYIPIRAITTSGRPSSRYSQIHLFTAPPKSHSFVLSVVALLCNPSFCCVI
jgi:hypothetical protein